MIDTGSWLPGKNVLVAPEWIRKVSWADRSIELDVGLERARTAPEYDADTPLTREMEQRLHEHFGRPGYWEAGGR